MFIIGLTGKIGCGKSTVREAMTNYYMNAGLCQIYAESFASKLKDMAMKYLGLTDHQVYTQEGKAEYNEFWGMTNREILQRIGTECFRKGFDENFWCKLLELNVIIPYYNRYKNRTSCYTRDIIIIDDVRFDNEAELIKKYDGKIIQIKRPKNDIKNVGIQEHASEKGISKDLIDCTIVNNCCLTELKEKVSQALRELGIANPEVNH